MNQQCKTEYEIEKIKGNAQGKIKWMGREKKMKRRRRREKQQCKKSKKKPALTSPKDKIKANFP